MKKLVVILAITTCFVGCKRRELIEQAPYSGKTYKITAFNNQTWISNEVSSNGIEVEFHVDGKVLYTGVPYILEEQ